MVWPFCRTFCAPCFIIIIVYFYWRIIALKYCVGFCYTVTWMNHSYTNVPSLWTSSHLHPIPLLYIVTEDQIWTSYIIHQIPTTYYMFYYRVIPMFQWYSPNFFPSSPPTLGTLFKWWFGDPASFLSPGSIISLSSWSPWWIVCIQPASGKGKA